MSKWLQNVHFYVNYAFNLVSFVWSDDSRNDLDSEFYKL